MSIASDSDRSWIDSPTPDGSEWNFEGSAELGTASIDEVDRDRMPLSTQALRRLVGRLTRREDDAALADLALGIARARSSREVRATIIDVVSGMAPGASVEITNSPPRAGMEGGVDIPLTFLGESHGHLRVRVAGGSRTIDPRLSRRLERIGPLVAAALQACAGRPPDHGSVCERRRQRIVLDLPRSGGTDRATGLPGADYLDVVLHRTYSTAPDTRLCILVITPNSLEEVRSKQGPVYADLALGVVARAVVATLRSSDPVVRFDADRIAAVLPGASACDARLVARSLGAAIAQAGLTASTPQPLTATIHVVTAPDDGRTVEALRRSVLLTQR